MRYFLSSEPTNEAMKDFLCTDEFMNLFGNRDVSIQESICRLLVVAANQSNYERFIEPFIKMVQIIAADNLEVAKMVGLKLLQLDYEITKFISPLLCMAILKISEPFRDIANFFPQSSIPDLLQSLFS